MMFGVYRTGLAVAGLTIGLFVGMPAAQASGKLYVYELPDGSRVVSGNVIKNKYYRLVRTGVDSAGVGQLAASQNMQFFRTDPSAYDDVIRSLADKHRVDFALVKAVMHVESSFNPYARSHKGALGLMQVMPETAKRHGIDDIYNPLLNIEAGVRHLKYLNKMFNGEPYLVLAAYNAGENAVLRYNGIPPYHETRNYVHRVLALKTVYSRT